MKRLLLIFIIFIIFFAGCGKDVEKPVTDKPVQDKPVKLEVKPIPVPEDKPISPDKWKKMLTVDMDTFESTKPGKQTIYVVSFHPQGEVRNITSTDEINITFSEPVAPLKQLKSHEKSLIQITPRISGEGYWKNTTTYCYRMDEKLEFSKKYEVKFLGYETFTGKTIKPKEWVFTTPTIKISRTRPHHLAKYQTRGQKVLVYFTQDVSPSRIKPFIEIHAGSEKYDFTLRYSTKEERKLLYYYYKNKHDKRFITITPSKKFPIATNIVVRFLPGLPSTEGNIGLKRLKELKFRTYEKFKVIGVDKDFYPDLGFKISLSNPVFRDELYKSISFDPPVKLQKPGHWDSREIYINGNFKPETTYTLKIPKTLKDKFGQRLDKESTYQVKCLNFSPYFIGPAPNHFVLESYLDKTIPVSVRNVFDAEIFYKKLSRSDILDLTENNHFRPWLLDLKSCHSFKWTPHVAKNKGYVFGFPLNEISIHDEGYYFISFPAIGYEYSGRTKKTFQLTNTALVAKFSPSQVLILGFNMETGEPVPDLKYEIYTHTKFLKETVPNLISTISADSDGIAVFNSSDATKNLLKSFVFSDPDKAFIWGQKQDMFDMWEFSWRYNIYYNYSPSSYYNHLLPFTDKHLYKAGQTVRFKGILRQVLLGHLMVPEIEKISVEVFSSRNEKIHTAEIGKDGYTKFGSFSGEFKLSQTAPSGYYRIKFTVEFPNDTKFYRTLSFSVQEYKPAKFEVKVTITQDQIISGESLTGVINGKYLFGTPMSKAKANYAWMLQSTYYSPPNHSDYSFGTYDTYYRHTIERKDFRLDRDGNFGFHKKKLTIPTKNSALLTVHGEVIDKDNNRISGKDSIVIHRGEYYIGVKTSTYFFEAGKPGKITIVTVTPKGEPFNNTNVDLKIVQKEWKSFQKKDASGALRWNWKEVITDILKEPLNIPDGKLAKDYTFTKPGYYEITLTGKDKLGNTIITTQNFYVTGSGYISWGINEGRLIDLVTDKKEYKPGDNIKLLIKSPFKTSTAMITVERENVIWSKVIRLEGNASSVNIPVKETFSPNVYINVIIMKERKNTEFDENGKDLGKPEFYSGYSQVSIDSSQHKLNIVITPNKDDYAPGDTVELGVTVRDIAGQPVESELCVSVVDKGVLNLVGYQLPDPLSFFWKKRPLDVKTVSTLNDVLGRQKYQEKGEDPGGGGDDTPGSSVVVRKNFKESAYYTAFLNTDKNGNATVSFKLPDNLTTFKAMIVAEDVKDKFGRTNVDILVKKKLILKPALPYFIRLGDVFSGGVTVTNNSEEHMNVSVTVESKDVDRVEGDTDVKTISLEPRATEAVLFKFKVGSPINPKLTFKAVAGPHSDGLFLEIPLRVPTMFEAVATSGKVEDKPVTEQVIVPEGTVRSMDTVEITLASSSMIGVKRNFEILQEYPYDCLEQRLSKQYPLLGAGDFLLEFGLLDIKKAELDKRITNLLSKMPTFQKSDGGFSYYPSSRWSSQYLTCYAVEFILMAKKKGYEYDKRMLKRSMGYLKKIANRTIESKYPYSKNVSLLVQSYAVYLLAEDGIVMKDVINNLFDSRDRIPFSGIAYLIKALNKKNDLPDYMQQVLTKMMLNKMKVAPTTAHFENADGDTWWWVHESNVKTTSIVLEALLTVYGKFPEADKISRWLTQTTKQKRYMSTQEHLRLFMAFEKYYKVFEKETPDYVAEVLFNNYVKIKEPFKGRNTGAKIKNIGLSEYKSGDKVNISFKREGQGVLYYLLRVKYYPIDLKEMKAINRGFDVKKIFKTMAGDIVEGDKFNIGEKYIVELIIETNKERAFVMVDDPVPAGFKVVNPNFRTSSDLDLEKTNRDSGWRGYWGYFYRSEYYFDRVEVFTDYLNRGIHKWKYIVIATNSGEYMMPNTFVQEMYSPEVLGRNDGKIIEIK